MCQLTETNVKTLNHSIRLKQLCQQCVIEHQSEDLIIQQLVINDLSKVKQKIYAQIRLYINQYYAYGCVHNN